MHAQVKTTCVTEVQSNTQDKTLCWVTTLTPPAVPKVPETFHFLMEKIQAAFGLLPLLLDSRFHLIASCYDEQHSLCSHVYTAHTRVSCFSHCCGQILHKRQLKEGWACFGSQFKGIQFIVVRKAWRQERVVTGHIASVGRKQRERAGSEGD